MLASSSLLMSLLALAPEAATSVVAAADAGPSHRHHMVITVGLAMGFGAMLMVLANRLRMPAIVLLLLGGVVLGPEVLGWVDPNGLGDGLLVIVSLAVGLILYEGGLTLDVGGYRSAPGMIKRLLTLGVMTTWGVTAAALWLIGEQPLRYAVVTASLVIVTGPTVIAPLLKRLQITPRLHAILHWEGVLIDPIGVFVALLCFEYVVSGETGWTAATNLATRMVGGIGIGVIGGGVLSVIIRRHWVPTEFRNIFSLASALLVFVLAELVHQEAGLLAVTIAGFVFALGARREVRHIREFKADLTDLLIGTLFILLAARLQLTQFQTFGYRGLLIVGIVMFVARPLSVFLCSLGTELTTREKLFLSWVAPRGIVAASMASLFSISIEALSADLAVQARFVETFVYSVIIATIVIQGFSAGPLARLLHLRRTEPGGWLIVGAHPLARGVADFIKRVAGEHAVLIDTNPRAVRAAQEEGYTAVCADARDAGIAERFVLHGIGRLLALTDNEDLNARLCATWSEVYGDANVYRCESGATIGAPGPAAGDGESDAEVAGTVVWAAIPKPSLLSAELTRGDAFLRELPGAPRPRRGTILAASIGGKFIVDPSREAVDAANESDHLLVLRRKVDDLTRSMHPSLIVDLESGDLPTVVRLLLERMVSIVPSIPREKTLGDLLEREAAVPNALGEGVAVPHSYVTALDRRLVGLARLREGFDHGAADGKPIRLVFLLLSPDGDPEGHLATLAEIARRMIDEDVRDRILNATTPEDVMRVIRRTRVSS
ncbi:MAG: cation:proton antiporter [Phycisphaerales bacterium]|nr:cation:proton antiporter [Phycisphaerales bacterium]